MRTNECGVVVVNVTSWSLRSFHYVSAVFFVEKEGGALRV